MLGFPQAPSCVPHSLGSLGLQRPEDSSCVHLALPHWKQGMSGIVATACTAILLCGLDSASQDCDCLLFDLFLCQWWYYVFYNRLS